MPETLNTKKLRIVPEEELIHKSDHENFSKQVLELLIAKDKKQDQKIDALGQAFRNLMADLRKEVDGLFVSDRVKKLEDDHRDRMSKVKDGEPGKQGERGQQGKQGIAGPQGISAAPSQEMINEALKGPMEDFTKNWENKVQGMIGSKRMAGGTPHNLEQVFNASSQADGSRRIFTGLPIARHYPMVFFRGQNPVALAADIDYTIGRGSITLLNHIEPPESGVNVYVKYVK